MTLSTHLVFSGQCEAAFRFYADVLGGTLGPMLTYGASPAGAEVPPEWREKIVHGSIRIGGMNLAGADVGPDRYAKAQGFFLLHSVADRVEAERVFARLAEGGEVKMPLQKTFWSPAFGVVIDRFGVPWEVSCEG
ncbi:MAG TPA: VOC family protein [Labilithrix sp.]|jgi:PhnB protein